MLNDPDSLRICGSYLKERVGRDPTGYTLETMIFLRSFPSHTEQVSLSLLPLAQETGKEFSTGVQGPQTPTSDCGTPLLST